MVSREQHRSPASGQAVEAVRGHFTALALIRRPTLFMLGSAYRFFPKYYHKKCPFWPSVVEELQCPSWNTEPTLLVSPCVAMLHASWWGVGGCIAIRPVEAIADATRPAKRWRFYEQGRRKVMGEGSCDGKFACRGGEKLESVFVS